MTTFKTKNNSNKKMGNTPAHFDFNMSLSYFAVSFSGSDKLRLILAPGEIVEITEKQISHLYRIQRLNKSDGLVELKLEGSPVEDLLKAKVIDFKLLLAVLIQSYFKSGWHIKSSICLDTYGYNGNTIIFEKSEPIPTCVSCVSFDCVDKVNVLGPEEIVVKVKEILNRLCPEGVEKESKNSFQHGFKHNGCSWLTFRIKEEYSMVELVGEIFKGLHEIGWVFCGSIQMHVTEISNLYFRYEQRPTPMHEMFALHLSKSDKISILNPPRLIIELIREMIESVWSNGMQSQTISSNVYEFRLKGAPWRDKTESLVESRRLLNKIIQNLKKLDYKIYAICDLSNKESKMSTFYFSKINEPNEASSKIVSLNLNESDKLRIIDDLDGFSDILRESISQIWPKGLKLESSCSGAIQFKLNGSPFSPFSSTNDTINFSMLILVLFEKVKKGKRLKFIGSADLCSDYIFVENLPYGYNIHTLMFESD
jgi:hypothetical protein